MAGLGAGRLPSGPDPAQPGLGGRGRAALCPRQLRRPCAEQLLCGDGGDWVLGIGDWGLGTGDWGQATGRW
ncbi:MAG: hypothetical protein DWI57_02455 [Chloroflexi bacterium]|nr:MAG: hypothetical protein DWI57_02455 [Chloroflexota bacterium]